MIRTPFVAALLALGSAGATLAQSPTGASLPTYWDRAAEFVPLQNPHPDSAGNLVWSYQTHRSNRPSGVLWSGPWGGWQSGSSARFSGGGLMNADGITAWLQSNIWKCWQCNLMEATFTNTTAQTIRIRIDGTYRLAWFDPFGGPVADADAQVRILLNPLNNHVFPIYDQVFSKPGGGTGAAGLTIDPGLGPIDLAPGDKIHTQVYGLSSSGGHNTWLRLDDSQVRYVRLFAARETVRRATPSNPLTLDPGVTNGPVLGAVWDPRLQSAPGTLAIALALGTGGQIARSTPFGTLLCDPLVLFPGSSPSQPFSVPIPIDYGLLGAEFSVQGMAMSSAQSLELSNALDIVVGSR